MSELSFRLALAEDAPFLARCVREVSGGVVDSLLTGLFPGIGAEQVLTMVLRDGATFFSYKNCVLAESDGHPVGLLFAYSAQEQRIPPLMKAMVSGKRLNPLLDVLTASVAESLHINTFWVDASMRGLGLSDALMDYAADLAAQLGFSKIGLFAWRDNERALGFYFRHNFFRVREVQIPENLAASHGHGDLYCREL